jgi:hypothetical protein
MAERSIGKLPRGLLPLLGLRDYGATPQDLASSLQATVDCTPMFGLDTREWVAFGTQVNPLVGINSFTPPALVPAGELWYVWAFQMGCICAAGEAIAMAPGANYEGTGGSFALNVYQAAAANETIRVSSTAPFWMGAGSEFTILVRSVTLNPDVSGGAFITRLKV